MQDFQQLLNQVLDYVKGIWIKKRYVMISTWLLCPVGFLYVASLPDTFQSKAVVYVDTRSVLQPLLRGLAIQSNPEQEVSMMAKTLLSRSNVEKIARESDLDLNTQTKEQFNALVTSLTQNIDLDSTGRDNIYRISFSHRSPETAQKVVQETLDLFVEGSLGNNRRDTDTAGRFLDEQIADYENRLTEAEQRLADFKRQYSNILPLQGSYYSSLQSFKDQLDATKLEVKQVDEQIESMKQQFDSFKSADSFDVTNNDSPVLKTRYDNRIKALEEELDRLLLRFTELHPDVQGTKALLTSLEEARKKEIEAFLDNDNEDAVASELNTEIRLELSRLKSSKAALLVKEQYLNDKITELRSKIDLVPQIEAESTALNRDYGITKDKYEDLLSRKEAASISRRADVSAEDLQFQIIEPPVVPTAPSAPNRIMMYTGILIAGFGLGVGIAFLLSQLSPVLIRAKQLHNLSDYPIWGTVSHFNKPQIKARNRHRLTIFGLSTGLLLAIYCLLVGAEIMNIKLF
ncbi:XrtA system polysaccharide chain length determinant [Alteromonas gilva]|uniref:Wzz/FepE/Etk N-terminal domain-containing protein n=1 Tax=Alteromonas gilva TaxID=2987522 RepID=A0ABT5L1M9_9ALTE|nr:XrtA system polysaccharide chain length determinant [Alteromonas gilva]MDC8830319.1 Wzz/FepE/Etk N-terminal domain-containing protein [Alteromonas gilva]